jgi:ubiquinone/menaquinone biosynthesis C-methylase UbiE
VLQFGTTENRIRTELERIFERVPAASLCFDIGHARQIDPTMTEAWRILTKFGGRLLQVHVSEVGTSSRHDRLSFASKTVFQQVAHLIPENVPLILETPATADTAMEEAREASAALPLTTQQAA